MSGPAPPGTLPIEPLAPRLSLMPFVRPMVPVVVLFAITALAYINADHEEYFFDDTGPLILNQETRHLGDSVSRLFRSPLTGDEQLARVTFAVNYRINEWLGRPGFEVRSFFIFNVLLHALNALLVYLLLRALLRTIDRNRPPPAVLPLLLAVIFAVHPIHGSSVAYICQRRGELATLFYLLAILSYLGVRGRRSQGGPWTARQLLLVASLPLCYWLSFKSKSFGLTLPVMLLAIEYVLRADDRESRRRFLMYLAPACFLIAAVAFWFLRSHQLIDLEKGEIKPYGPAELWGAWPHFLSEARAFLHYWKLLLLPLPQWLCIDHEFTISMELMDGYALKALIANGALLVAAWLAARRRLPLAALGVFWFYVAVAPYAALRQFDVLVEYKAYLASIGAILIVAEIIRRPSTASFRTAKTAALSLACMLLLFTTWRRNVVYQSQLNVWTDAVQKYPDAARPHLSLGAALLNLDRPAEAKPHFERALEIEPLFAAAWSNLAIVLDSEGKTDEAILKYREAIRIHPDYAEAHNNIAAPLIRQGKIDEAIQHYREAVRIRPDYYDALLNLGVQLAKTGRTDEAMAQWSAAIKAEPAIPNAYLKVAHAFLDQKKTNEGIRYLEAAVARAPDYIDGWIELGNLLAVNGRTNDAIRSFKQVIRIKGDLAPAHNSLGTLYSSQGLFDNAMVHFQEAIRLQPKFVAAIVNLANALQRQGRVEEAMQMYRHALTLEPANIGARFFLAAAFMQAKRIDEAINEYREVVRLNPGYAEGHLYLGFALESKGLREQSSAEIAEAIRLRPELAAVRDKMKNAPASQRAG